MIKFYKKSLVWGPSAAGWPLGNALGITKKALLSRNSRAPSTEDTVINWGMSYYPAHWQEQFTWFNSPVAVKDSANKINMMQCFMEGGIPCLDIVNPTELDLEVMVVARHLLSSHSGNGIEINPAGDISRNAALYTRLGMYDVEQRLFVVGDTIVDIAEKKKMGKAKREANGISSVHPYIRSWQHGWVYAHKDINHTPESAKAIGIEAMASVGLFFGAVDIAWNDNEFVVIEVNSAPGFKNSDTINKFSEELKKWL